MSHFKKRAVLEDEEGEERGGRTEKKRRLNITEEDEESDGEARREEDYDSIDEYDEEGYKGEADRRALALMSEMDREELLYTRHTRMERRRETLELRQKMREKAAAAEKGAARKGAERGRAATSASEVKSNKMKELAARREEKKERERERERTQQEEAEAEGEAEEEEEEEVPREETRPRPAEAEAASAAAERSGGVQAPVAHLERIRLKRDLLEKWLNEPFFEKVVPGCFVRIGTGSRDGRPTYRVAEVVQVKDNFRQYNLGAKLTSKRLELQLGESRRFFQLSYVSNADFTKDELDYYHRVLKAASIAGKTTAEIEAKVKQLVRCRNAYEYTAEEVDKMVKEQKKSLKNQGNLAHRRAAAMTELQEGKDSGDAARVANAEKALKAIEEEVEREKKRDEKRAGSTFRIQDINVRNADFMRQVEQVAGKRDLLEASEISAGRVTATDPFKRLPIRPVIYWNVGKQEEPPPAPAPAAAPAAALTIDVHAAPAKPSASLISPGFEDLAVTPVEPPREIDPEELAMSFEPLGGLKPLKPQANKLPPLQGKRATAHQGVEIEIDLELKAPMVPRRQMAYSALRQVLQQYSAVTTTSPRATLSVTDYKRRMGIL